uniref:Uncharacterized protein n=1 Tax=Anguilla anguilla TaxID=7936 RepID=A0A0E9U1Q3_ANGAN
MTSNPGRGITISWMLRLSASSADSTCAVVPLRTKSPSTGFRPKASILRLTIVFHTRLW